MLLSILVRLPFSIFFNLRFFFIFLLWKLRLYFHDLLGVLEFGLDAGNLDPVLAFGLEKSFGSVDHIAIFLFAVFLTFKLIIFRPLLVHFFARELTVLVPTLFFLGYRAFFIENSSYKSFFLSVPYEILPILKKVLVVFSDHVRVNVVRVDFSILIKSVLSLKLDKNL